MNTTTGISMPHPSATPTGVIGLARTTGTRPNHQHKRQISADVFGGCTDDVLPSSAFRPHPTPSPPIWPPSPPPTTVLNPKQDIEGAKTALVVGNASIGADPTCRQCSGCSDSAPFFLYWYTQCTPLPINKRPTAGVDP